MAIPTSHQTDDLARTIEFKKALVHLRGKSAGVIEVPIFIGYPSDLHCDLDELSLHVEGEQRLLRPIAREHSDGQLRLMYLSNHVRKTGQLPLALQLHWGDSLDDETGGMELLFRETTKDR